MSQNKNLGDYARLLVLFLAKLSFEMAFLFNATIAKLSGKGRMVLETILLTTLFLFWFLAICGVI